MSWPPNNTSYCTWEPTDASWLEIVESIVGLGGNDVPFGNRQAFIDLIAPLEQPQVAAYMIDKMSTCALAVRGLWRCYGVKHDLLYKPYVVGRAVTDIVDVARTHSAWSTRADIEPGDVVLVGGDASGAEHVLTVVSINDSEVTSVDGGQVDKHGKQIIKLVTRAITQKNTGTYFGSRKVNGICKMSLVPSYFDKLIITRI